MPKAKKQSLALHRPNAGVVLFNRKGQVFLAHRNGDFGALSWQFPQGGIDSGEKPLAAAYRELHEETGVRRKHVRLMGKVKGWLAYDFPDDVTIAPAKRKKWKGQKQKWYAMRFLGKNRHIDLALHKPQEFDAWKWVNLADVPPEVISWKQDVYIHLVRKFSRFAVPGKK